MIGRTPMACSRTTSLTKDAFSSSDTMALPPYLMTNVRRANRLKYGSASCSTRALETRVSGDIVGVQDDVLGRQVAAQHAPGAVPQPQVGFDEDVCQAGHGALREQLAAGGDTVAGQLH